MPTGSVSKISGSTLRGDSVVTIPEILSLNPRPEDFNHRSPDMVEVVRAFQKQRKSRSLAYEDEVFNFLYKNRDALRIERLYRSKNLRMDGKLELAGGVTVAIEIKLRMNWLKACQ